MRRRVEERLGVVERAADESAEATLAAAHSREAAKEAAVARQANELRARRVMGQLLEEEKREAVARVARKAEFARAELRVRMEERDAKVDALKAEADTRRQVATLAANAERKAKSLAKRQLLEMQEPVAAARYVWHPRFACASQLRRLRLLLLLCCRCCSCCCYCRCRSWSTI